MLRKQIQDVISAYLQNGLDRAGFAERFAALYFQCRNGKGSEIEAQRLCDAVIGPFAELSRGDRSEKSFREELTRIVSPVLAS